MKLGIVSDEVHPDLAYAAPWAASRGISRMELRSIWGHRVPDISSEQLKETVTILKDHGIVVSGLSPGICKCSLQEPEFVHQRDRLLRTMDMAATLGTKKIISFGIKKDKNDSLDAFDRVIAQLQEFTWIAASQGFVLCLENEPGYYNGTPDEIEQVQRAVYPLGGRLNWDMGNLFMAGYTEYKPYYERFKDFIASIHMKDYRPDGCCVPLGDGCLSWEKQMCDFIHDDLHFEDEEVDMNLETHCRPLEECAERSFDFVKACLHRINAK